MEAKPKGSPTRRAVCPSLRALLPLLREAPVVYLREWRAVAQTRLVGRERECPRGLSFHRSVVRLQATYSFTSKNSDRSYS